MNPMSNFTYYRRNRRHALILFALMGLVTAAMYLTGAMLSTAFDIGRLNYMFLSKFSIVNPEIDENGADPTVIAQIRANLDVERVIPASTFYVRLPAITGTNGFDFLGLMADDLPYILEKCGATLIAGRMLEPGTNGLLLSEKVATSLGLQVGDIVESAVDPELYNNVIVPLEVVGILESDVRLGIVSLEFYNHHESFRGFAELFLVVARDGRETAVDDYLWKEIQTPYTTVQTYQSVNQEVNQEYLKSFGVLAPSVIIVAIAFALVVVAANWVAFSKRLPELGILHAMGYSRKSLTRHLMLETATLSILSWTVGLSLSWLALLALDLFFFAPHGQDISIIMVGALGLTLPLPIAVIGFTFFGIRGIISRLDPIAIIEQSELSQEKKPKRRITTSSSSPKPLAAMTFYRRHKRRVLLLISAMSMMIVAVVLVVFTFDVSQRAQTPASRFLSQVSWVRSYAPGEGPNPGIIAQVRTHPLVEKVIPVAPRYHMFGVHIPPFLDIEASPFGVYAEDMKALVELYDLKLKEGRLPQPYTNELVIPEALARNRDLEIGDVIGDPEHPAYPGANPLPAQFVISGIFAQSKTLENENWLGFVSLEFLESHEAFRLPDSLPIFVVPKSGQKDILNDWLENELTSEKDVEVLTFRQEIARDQQELAVFLLVMGAVEILISIVAAVALAGLNHIFISQRQPEFGILHALGFKRRHLVGRGLQETVFTTGAAWGLSAFLVLLVILYIRFNLFEPLGLVFDLFNGTPWFYTLPIPVSVLVVTASTITWTLRKIDPVTIIEQR